MEDPVAEISTVVHLLTQSPPSVQGETVDRFFTRDAESIHPFCRIWKYNGSRWGVKKIYQWYKIMSPHIDLEVRSIAYDKDKLKLYLSMHQVFSIWIVPFHTAPVALVTVLDLATDPGDERQESAGGKKQYYIRKQEDFYQTSEFIKFVVPYGGHMLVMMWHAFASLFSIMGVFLLWPVMWAEERGFFDHHYRIANGAREGVVEYMSWGLE
ncbi:hypothetical protein AN5339.2 [Aspergillus nidulans FGSC A4]|nr:hypothetical protein AN5339.2 [Aspergillus nidulans FGSC A4]|eukprot:XP_662943.1 hypothetical protein AN5339.2 [Aspergillus nidulans FGSC A4]